MASGFYRKAKWRGRDAYVLANNVSDALDALRLPIEQFDASTSELLEVRSLGGTIRRSFLGYELKSFEVLASVLGSTA